MGIPKSRARRGALLLAGLVGLAGITACGGSSEPPSTTTVPPTTATTTRPPPTTSGPTTTSAAPGGIAVSPEFVQGTIPGAHLVLLVTLTDPESGEAAITAEAPGAAVTVSPEWISGTEVAEVFVIPQPVTGEGELSITITATPPGDASAVSRRVTVVPWEDDRGEQAAEILTLFTGWLADNRPELNLGPETEFTGTFVAPMLLVVSHYAFFGYEWELGLSWHVMIPPDDFAELYLRRRTELAPVYAFRLGSWQTALETGVVEITAVKPPVEVVR